MNDLSWQTLALNPLTAFGLLLLLGVIGGQLITRATKFPAITGYILIGLIIGPTGLNVVDHKLLHEANIFTQLALGLALFEIGQRVDLKWLKLEKALLLTTVLIGALVLAALSTLLYFSGFTPLASLLMGTLGMASSPIIILEIVRTTRSEGQVTERLVHATALGSLMSMTAFALVLSYIHISHDGDLETGILTPTWLILGSVFLGLATALIAIHIKQWISGRQRQAQRVLVFGSIALVAGLAEILHMLPSLALLTLGLATRNSRSGYSLIDKDLIPATSFFFVVYFVAAGAQLSPLDAGPGTAMFWSIAVAYLVLRTLVTVAVWWALASFNGMTRKRATMLGLAQSAMPDNAAALLGLGLVALGLNTPNFMHTVTLLYVVSTLLGPIVTRMALIRAGEAKPLEK